MAASMVGKAAEWYGRKGYPVIPLHSITPDGCTCCRSECDSPGKHPLILRWPENASRAATVIRFWWRRWPEANVGLVTGAASGLVVLDVDVRHGGHHSLEELERQHGDLPKTVEAETGSSGRHILFKHPGTRVSNSAGLLGPGLDVRGDGGYIVVPPSLHACGRRYAWDPTRHPAHIEPASLPPWLLKALTQPKIPKESSIKEPVPGFPPIVDVSEGQRNTTLTRLTGYLLSHRISMDVSIELLKSWNALNCRPPLTEDEVMRTIDSIAGSDLRRRG